MFWRTHKFKAIAACLSILGFLSLYSAPSREVIEKTLGFSFSSLDVYKWTVEKIKEVTENGAKVEKDSVEESKAESALAKKKAKAKPFKVYVVTWIGNSEVERGFMNYFASRDIPVEFIVRNGDLQVEKIKEFRKEIKELQPDLVYVLGTPPTIELVGQYDKVDPSKHITDIPLVFNLVAQPILAKIAPTFGAGTNRNITGHTHLPPMEAQVKSIKSYMPVKKITAVFNEVELNSSTSVDELEALGKSLGKDGFTVERVYIPRDPATNLAIPGKIIETFQSTRKDSTDLIYIPSDGFLIANTKLVGEALKDIDIPSFSPAESFILEGNVLMGLVARFYQVGQYTGYKAEQILVKKTPVGKIPVDRLNSFFFIIRKDTFNRIGLYPPINMLKYAEIIE